jgi:antitoxin component YwqK of YwqJK toxin-antitoxin module
MWNEQGVAVDEGEYDQGQPIGKHILRFANGKPKEELIYHTPTRFDKREWTEEGLLIFEGIYSADLSYVEKKFDAETKVMKERHGFWDGEKLCWK